MAGARPAPSSDRSSSWGSGAAGSEPSWSGVPGWGVLGAGELLGHSLAVGPGVNPVGDLTLAALAARGLWEATRCYC